MKNLDVFGPKHRALLVGRKADVDEWEKMLIKLWGLKPEEIQKFAIIGGCQAEKDADDA